MAVNLSSNDSLCLESEKIYTNVWLILLFCLTLVLDILAFVCCAFGAKSVYFTQLLHVNLRISLFSISVALLVRAAFTAFRCVRYLMRAIIVSSPCDFLDMTVFCNTYSGLHSWPYVVVVYTMPIITAERMIALLASSRYESWTFPKIFTLINLATWVAGGVAFYLKLTVYTIQNVPVPYCSSFTADIYNTNLLDLINTTTFIIPSTCLCIDILMRFVCKFLVKKLFRNEFHRHSLTHRYQLNEILRTAKIAIPASLVFCFLNMTSGLIIDIPVAAGLVTSTQDFSLIKEFSSLSAMPIYTIIYGIILYWYTSRPIHTVFGCCQRRQVKPSVPATTKERAMQETNVYFQIYSARW